MDNAHTFALLRRLARRIQANEDTSDWHEFARKLNIHGDHLRALLFSLYGQRDDFDARLEDILATAACAWLDRPADLKALDAEREANPRWFQSNQMLGGIAYVDLFAPNGNLEGIQVKIPYFYRDDPNKATDSRWVHRPRANWEACGAADRRSAGRGAYLSRLAAHD